MADVHNTEEQWKREVKTSEEPQDTDTPAPAEYTAIPKPVTENQPQEYYVDGVALTDLSAVVGRNTRYYLPRFLRMGDGFSGGWNWGAFLFGHWWLIYRKQYVTGIVLLVIQTMLDLIAVFMCSGISPNATMEEMMEILLQNPFLIPWTLCYYAFLITHIYLGVRGNRLYLRNCQRKIRGLRSKIPDLSSAELVSRGGTALGMVAFFYIISYLISMFSTYFIT